jgi:hypothetical protein
VIRVGNQGCFELGFSSKNKEKLVNIYIKWRITGKCNLSIN